MEPHSFSLCPNPNRGEGRQWPSWHPRSSILPGRVASRTSRNLGIEIPTSPCILTLMKSVSLLLMAMITAPVITSSAASSGSPFYGDPPDEHHPWAIHDQNRPQPTIVTPGSFSSQQQPGQPPSDARILFDGSDLSKWRATREGNGPAKWTVRDGYVEVAPGAGDIVTAEQFGDCQLHVEWAAPTEVKGSSQGRGNSGIFLMGICEIQVLDCYDNVTYADGQAASVYGVNPPMANALRPPGQFQVYDIVFRRPIFKDGKELDPGYATVFVNGVLVQDHARLEGATGHMRRTQAGPFPEKGPLKLQDHGNPVRFRNIWYRPLPPRAIEGGTDGWLTTEATMAKRKAIAEEIRKDAAQLKNDANPLPEMFRLLESLEYDAEPAAAQRAEALGSSYVASLKALAANQLPGRKDEAKRVLGAYQFLNRFKILPTEYPPEKALETLVKAQGWDKK